MPGPTDQVVVVGAGLAGLSAALQLAGAGRTVTVLERAAGPGGVAGRWCPDGYRIDTGPTVLTLPRVLEDTFRCVGERLADWLELIPLDPVYRGHFPDGSTLDVRADPAATAEEVRRLCGPAEAAGFDRLVGYLRRLYRLLMPTFIDRNFDRPRQLAGRQLAELVRLGGFTRWPGQVHRYLADPRTRRLFTFQALYAGVTPPRALALYAVIAYMDSVAGVYVPRGGVHAVPATLTRVAERHGVLLRFGTPAVRLECRGERVVAVHTGQGERLATDVVVLTGDLAGSRRLLPPPAAHRPGGAAADRRRPQFAPSCFQLLAGSARRYSQLAHHNLHFGRSWSDAFAELTAGRLMSDPSFLVGNPTRTDPSLAPPHRQVYQVLVPTPNALARIDWPRLSARYAEEVLGHLQARGYLGFADAVEVLQVNSPADWLARGYPAGTPFGLAHTAGQTGPLRPANLVRHPVNAVFAGAGTHPGLGVPMVLLSGRLAAQRVVGARPR